MLAQHRGRSSASAIRRRILLRTNARAFHPERYRCLLHPLSHSRAHLLGLHLGFFEASEALLPFRKFRIAQHGILNNLIAFVLVLQRSSGRFLARGANELAQRRIEHRRLGAQGAGKAMEQSLRDLAESRRNIPNQPPS